MEIVPGHRSPGSKTPASPRQELQVRRQKRSEINLISRTISSCRRGRPRHRRRRRPVLTPAYPQRNSAAACINGSEGTLLRYAARRGSGRVMSNYPK